MVVIDLEAEQRFFEEMGNSDALGVVIRGLIYVEHELIALLNENLVNPKAARISSMEYSAKVDLAVAIGLREDLGTGLKALGTLRNSLAHNLRAEVNASAANNAYKALSALDKEIVQGTFSRVQKLNSPRSKTFAALDPLDRVRILMVSLRQAVRAALNVSKAAREEPKRRWRHFAPLTPDHVGRPWIEIPINHPAPETIPPFISRLGERTAPPDLSVFETFIKPSAGVGAGKWIAPTTFT